MRRQAIAVALCSAALFGASTPITKLLLDAIEPLVLASVLYLGSGIGLAGWLLVRRAFGRAPAGSSLSRTDYLWLAAAIAAGGVVAPVLLVFGQRDLMVPPKNAGPLRDALAGKRVVTIPECGHSMMAEAPDVVLDTLREFIASLS